jgi:tetratricopeptide (TPR) repeat protein
MSKQTGTSMDKGNRMSSTPSHQQPRGPSSGVIERLYVLCIASSAALLLLIVVLTLFAAGLLRKRSEALSQSIVELNERLTAVEQTLAEQQAPPLAAVSQRAQITQPDDERETTSGRPASGPATAEPAEQALDDAAVNARLDRVLVAGDDLPVLLADPRAGADTLEQVLRDAPQARWTGETWARVAVLARLLEHNDEAEMYARRAAADGVLPWAYNEVSARLALMGRRGAEALTFAQRLTEQAPGHPIACLLLAQAFALQGNLAAADDALNELDNLDDLPYPDKLRLGYLLIDLERWEALGAVLDALGPLPEELIPERDYLRAAWLVQKGQLAEALAILDYLLELHPDDYDVRTWRGVALIQAGQFEAAREALAHAEQAAGRPEAWYWLGVLEIEAGNPEAALPYLQRCFAASARYAPAWEALGTLALNRGDLPTALENLGHAIEINPHRSSAHFLIAIVHAKASRREEAAQALQEAFSLDEALLETAKQTEVLTRLFAEQELENLAPAASGEQPGPPAEPPATPLEDQPPESP